MILLESLPPLLRAFPCAEMEVPKLIWGAASWLPVAAAVAGLLLILVIAGYSRGGATGAVRLAAGCLKILGVLILAACLLEPLASGSRARPGATVRRFAWNVPGLRRPN